MTLTEKLTLLLNFGNEDLSNVECAGGDKYFHSLSHWDLQGVLLDDIYELRIKEQK
jgi:hypothetical protein